MISSVPSPMGFGTLDSCGHAPEEASVSEFCLLF